MKDQLCDPTELTVERVLRRCPRIVAHLICESLGWFSVRGAANVIVHYKNREAFYNDLYETLSEHKYGRLPTEEELIEINADFLRKAIVTRHFHSGLTYDCARAAIQSTLEGNPKCWSWFFERRC